MSLDNAMKIAYPRKIPWPCFFVREGPLRSGLVEEVNEEVEEEKTFEFLTEVGKPSPKKTKSGNATNTLMNRHKITKTECFKHRCGYLSKNPLRENKQGLPTPERTPDSSALSGPLRLRVQGFRQYSTTIARLSPPSGLERGG